MKLFSQVSYWTKITALSIGLISLSLTAFFSTVVVSLTEFAFKYMNPNVDADQDIYIFIIKLTLILFIAFLFFISFSLLCNLHVKFYNFINSIINTEKLYKTIVTDPLTSKTNFSKFVFITATSYAIILHLIYLIFGNIYDDGAGSLDESMAEYISSFLLIISSIILLVSILMLKNVSAPNKDKRIIRTCLSILSLMFLFVFMEEFSWGQQIFQWETTGTLNEINFQKETNLHNVIQPLLKFMYPLGGIGLFFILLLLWFFPRGKEHFWLNLLTPHISLIYLVFFMACVSFDGLLLSELFELLFYPFLLLYSIRILVCILYPSTKRESV
ncbi:MAG: hypothetical protein HKO81_04520 [Flavobacteriaceae bacterium]|nr:hypothetical protein [Flavobacteriaceae bacterium]